ncbi:hypothetical protein V6N13_042242 [Hibiscus sabdariffa]|uniref:Uncharacterized protein n=1 Tax=Hibiscus sabdariffa TaxID=183260 RepID=A0ABR2DG62_9ROSI
MDSGLSWADQWDTNSDPGTEASGNGKKKKKGGSGKSKFNKSLLSFKWIKELKNKVIMEPSRDHHRLQKDQGLPCNKKTDNNQLNE